ncbi:MAG: DUF2442 domain-containing protein [Coleofasciculaceae cyanobacterium SM2_1_6]|nr:DUF2442 domain-containing protein [Coleofasciculaceae cyanobacterium SM2_1_6]
MKPERIISAKAIDSKTLIVKFANFETKKYDISRLLNNPMFASLRNPSFFKNFRIEPGGYGLVWNDEIDLSEYELWQHGVDFIDDQEKS